MLLYVYVTGPSGSGKSQFIHTLSEGEGPLLDESAGIEYFTFPVDESLDLCLFSSLDPTRFDPLLQLSQQDILGYILMIDSADADTWPQAQVMLETCRQYALLPTLIAANKQDIGGAESPEHVGAQIGLANMVHISGCVATDPTSARELFLQFLYTVNHEIERLDQLILQIEELTAQEANSETDF